MSKMRYKTMTKEQIVEFVEKCPNRSCNDCPAKKGYEICNPARCIARYLTAEATMKKRWQTIKSDEDLMRIEQEFKAFCLGKSCSTCEMGKTETSEECFRLYLCQEIEVSE